MCERESERERLREWNNVALKSLIGLKWACAVLISILEKLKNMYVCEGCFRVDLDIFFKVEESVFMLGCSNSIITLVSCLQNDVYYGQWNTVVPFVNWSNSA